MRDNRIAESDEGFSLIETLVSLTLVIVTMGAVGSYLVGSFGYVAHQRGEQVASQLANSALEQVRALKGSSLSSGRGKDKAYAQFGLGADGTVASALTQPIPAVADYLADMTPAYDADEDTDAGEDAPIPTRSMPVTVDSITYDRTVYLGECEIDLRTDEGQNGGCLRATTHAANADETDFLAFFRAVVLVTWQDRFCANSPGTTCSYVTSTLISRAVDPIFSTNRPLPVINRQNLNPIYFYLGAVTKYTIAVYGGSLPNKWTTLPKVPDGLVIDQNGVITGTPTKIGKVKSSGTVTDFASRSNTAELNFEVVAPPTVTVAADIRSHPGDTLNVPVTVTNGTPNIEGCTLTKQPDGVTLEQGGDARTYAIKGTYSGPVQAFTLKIVCTDRPRSVRDRIAIATPKLSFYPAVQLTAPADQQITLGQSLNATATASGGDQNFTYVATGLPAGVTINATTGAISGVPTESGRFLPTIEVTDGSGGTVQKAFVVIVNATTSLKFTAPPLNAPDPDAKFTTNGQLLGLTTILSATGAPPGVSFNSAAGKFMGNPTTPGTYTVTVVATSILPPATSRYTFLWTVP